MGDYIAWARRNGDRWYLGAMTDWDARELDLNLSFLGEGLFKMEVFKDGVNASEYAEDYRKETLDVNNNAKIAVKMAAGGGWAAIISRK